MPTRQGMRRNRAVFRTRRHLDRHRWRFCRKCVNESIRPSPALSVISANAVRSADSSPPGTASCGISTVLHAIRKGGLPETALQPAEYQIFMERTAASPMENRWACREAFYNALIARCLQNYPRQLPPCSGRIVSAASEWYAVAIRRFFVSLRPFFVRNRNNFHFSDGTFRGEQRHSVVWIKNNLNYERLL